MGLDHSKNADAARVRPAGPTVCVFGSNDVIEGDLGYEFARGVGKALAGLGYVVANGGYAGTMEASARGAKEAGGRTVAVTCRLWDSPANKYMDEAIQTDDLFARVRRLIALADGGFVVLPGGTGTLVEFALAWELMAKRMMQPRPLVCMTGFWRPVVELMISQKPRIAEYVTMAQSPGELGKYFAKMSDIAT